MPFCGKPGCENTPSEVCEICGCCYDCCDFYGNYDSENLHTIHNEKIEERYKNIEIAAKDMDKALRNFLFSITGEVYSDINSLKSIAKKEAFEAREKYKESLKTNEQYLERLKRG